MNMSFRADMANQWFNNNTPAADSRLWLVSFIEPEMQFFLSWRVHLLTSAVIGFLTVFCRNNSPYNVYILVAKIKIEE